MDPSDTNGNGFGNEPQVIKPESMFNPSVPSQKPPEPAPQPASQPPQDNTPFPGADDGKKKRIFIVIGAAAGIFILVLIVVIVLSGGNNGAKKPTDQNGQSSGILQEPTALDIENANNSISSDITSLNDDNDFPTDNLTDTKLQL